MTKLRKILFAVAAVGGAATAIGAGTFASFSASTSNAGTFETGTLVLSNSTPSQASCLSTGGGSTNTNSNACGSLFSVTVAKPGDAATVDVTLKNDGSIDASALTAYATSACAAANSSGTYHGDGDPCSVVDLYIQEFSDAARTTASACRYGGGTATTCAYDTSKTLAAFSTAYPSSTTAVALGATAKNTSRYFRIGLQMDASAGNNMQGRQASFGVTWALAQ
jgi:predicted ribosomally synthesized peptide with SipW-like signal peptide